MEPLICLMAAGTVVGATVIAFTPLRDQPLVITFALLTRTGNLINAVHATRGRPFHSVVSVRWSVPRQGGHREAGPPGSDAKLSSLTQLFQALVVLMSVVRGLASVRRHIPKVLATSGSPEVAGR